MKKLSLTVLLLVTSMAFSQNLVKEELTQPELEFIAKDIKFFRTGPTETDFQNSIKNNLTTYSFEIEYDDHIIYRGGLKKPSVSEFKRVDKRNSVAFCFDYNTFDSDTKLELAENSTFNIGKTTEGKKYYWIDDYELFNISRTKEVTVNNKVSERINIRFYKTTQE